MLGIFSAVSPFLTVSLEEADAPTPLTPFTHEEIESFTLQARELHDQGNYDGAVELLTQILEHNPDHVPTYARIAHTYRYAYRYPESEEWFKKAIALDPTDSYLHTDLGKLYRNMGKFPAAEAEFLVAVSLDPFFATNYGYGLGYLYLEEGRFDESEVMFKKALELDPQDAVTFMSLGDLYRETKEYALSEEMFKRAIALDPKSEAYFGMGILFEHQGDMKQAEAMYRTYLQKIREKAEVYNALSRVLIAQEKFREAAEAAQRAVALNPGNIIFEGTLVQAQAGL